MSPKDSRVTKAKSPLFHPGDVVWAYVKGYPWWPAVVSDCPVKGDQETPWFQSKTSKYHVQFLGPVLEHQWLGAASLSHFKTKIQFEYLSATVKKKPEVPKKLSQSWESGVEEALEYAKVADLEHRVDMLTNKLLEAEEKNKLEKEKNYEDKVKLVVALYNSQTFLLNHKSLDVIDKRLRSLFKEQRNSSEIKFEPFSLTEEDAKALSSLNIDKDCVINIAICRKSPGLRETKSLSEEPCSKSPSKKIRNASESPSKKKLKSVAQVTESQRLLMSVSIVEAIQNGGSKLQQALKHYKNSLIESLSSAAAQSPSSESKAKARRSESLHLLTLKEAVQFLGTDGQSPIKRSLEKIEKQLEKQRLKEKALLSKSKGETKPDSEVAVPEPVEVVDPLKQLYSDPNVKDKVCVKCEGDAKQMIICIECVDAYHPKCLPDEEVTKINPSSGFKCTKCISGERSCFSCCESLLDIQADLLFRCPVPNCRKWFHSKCLEKFPALKEDKNSPKKKQREICPQHVCAACFPFDTAVNKLCFAGKFMRCLKCPLAYHSRNEERCFPAGSAILNNHYLICPSHFSKMKAKISNKSHLNVNWCFFCGIGGDLILCEMCPAAFHTKCAGLSEKPTIDKPWFCENCQAGIFPRFGDIVWVKCGAYRWWPARIVQPEDIPDNIQRKHHDDGDFAVQFFGSHDYMWTVLGRVFLFEENDNASKSNNSHLSQVFEKGLAEAIDAFRTHMEMREKERSERLSGSTGKTPAPYKYVTHNIPQGNVKVYKADLDTYATCSCQLEDPDPCGPSSNCENRYTLIECHPKLCSAKDKCQNQRFAKAQYAETYYFKCGDRGWGLKNKKTIYPGEFVNEYCGDLIDYEEYERRLRRQNERGELDFYFCVLDSKRLIDAKPKGCHSRFMNHSCDPNCDGQVWTVNGDIRVGLFAKREIPPDTELTFNYNLSSLGIVGGTKKRCLCGADLCSGFIGEKPKMKLEVSKQESTKGSSKRKRKMLHKLKRKMLKSGEKECFRCGLQATEGSFIVCGRSECCKSYHLKCMNMSRRVTRWECPRHFCDECGQVSAKFCCSCDNSFCKNHFEGNFVEIDGVELKCKFCMDSSSSCSEETPQSPVNKENVLARPLERDLKQEPKRRSSPRKIPDSTLAASTATTSSRKTPTRVLTVKQENLFSIL